MATRTPAKEQDASRSAKTHAHTDFRADAYGQKTQAICGPCDWWVQPTTKAGLQTLAGTYSLTGL